MQVITKVMNERCFGARTGQKTSIGRQRIKGTKESEAFDEFTHIRVHGDHTFRCELPSGLPIDLGRGAKAVRGQIGTLTDAHAGVANRQKGIAAQVVAAEKFLLSGVHPVLQ
jgi:hypothetical protein